MKLAISIEVPISEFWEMTPYELNLIARNYYEKYRIKQETEQKQSINQAYLISRWVWATDEEVKKHMKEILGHIDGDQKEKKIMTDEEMLNQVKVLNAMFGGEVKEK